MSLVALMSVSVAYGADNEIYVEQSGATANLDLEQLRNIKSDNLEGVIAGKSFYVGNIDLKEAQKILDGNA